MENNFEERRKDVDLSNIDLDAHSFQRKKLELDAKYEARANTEMSFYTKERELANNNDDEILRRIKVKAIDKDYANKLIDLQLDYEDDLKEICNKYKKNNDIKFEYYKMRYIGEIGKYSFPVIELDAETGESRVICNDKKIFGMSDYYIKLDTEKNKIGVYNDAKFTSLVGEIEYIPSEWMHLDMIV